MILEEQRKKKTKIEIKRKEEKKKCFYHINNKNVYSSNYHSLF